MIEKLSDGRLSDERLSDLLDNVPKDTSIYCGLDAASEREKKYLQIFKWLLGYTNFPERQIGEGAYYWRTPLSKKLKRIGIDFSKRAAK